MKLQRCRLMYLAASTVALAAALDVARAQTYPSHPITMTVGFAAGGPTDVTARVLADRMRATLGQPVIVENVAGAAGSIGAGRVARAAPDGYTVSFGQWGTHVVNGALYALPYDVLNDFEPVALVSSNPWLVVARKTMPAADLKGLIAWLKTNPDKASQGTAGAGAASHIAGAFLQKETATRFQFVPYRGAGPAMQDLVSGIIDIMIDSPTNSLPQIRAGTIKAYAVTAKDRLASAPDIQTVDEAGLPGMYISFWQALWVPKGTPRHIIAKLNGAVLNGLADPAVRRKLAEIGQGIFPPDQQTPEALGAFQRAEIAKWWPIIKAANIKAE
jgi:tripartite-type tricarboxylate transporter receptor subunit TctC